MARHLLSMLWSLLVLDVAFQPLVPPVSAKVLFGTLETADCLYSLGSFEYGTETPGDVNLKVVLDIPSEYDNVWILNVPSFTDFIGDDDLTEQVSKMSCYNLMQVFTAAMTSAEASIVPDPPLLYDYLSFGSSPVFPSETALMRFNTAQASAVGATTTTDSLVPADACECCEDAIESVLELQEAVCNSLTQPGFNNYVYQGHVAEATAVNLFLVNVNMELCDSSESASPNCQGPLMNITYTVEFLYDVPGSFFEQLSSNNVTHFYFLCVLVVLYLIATILASMINRELKKLEKNHWTARILIGSVYLGLITNVLFFVDILIIAASGTSAGLENDNGGYVSIFETAALVFLTLTDAGLMTVGVLLGKGWSIVRRKLSARSRMIYGTLVTIYILAGFAAVFWHAATKYAYDDEKPIYDSDPGYMVAGLRFALFMGFIWAFTTTLRTFKTKKRFFQKLFILFSLWILLQPLVGFFVSNSGLCYGIISMAMWFCQFAFLLMFWPNQRFNSGFPFHIRTTQMDDSTERSAKKELEDLRTQLEDAGIDADADPEIKKRMDEIRAATNPLSRSRVILQRLTADIKTMMTFSTELGRALEEMQTKDDDPESGEELEDVETAPTEQSFGSEHASRMRRRKGRRRGTSDDEPSGGVEMAPMDSSASRGRRSRRSRLVDEDDD